MLLPLALGLALAAEPLPPPDRVDRIVVGSCSYDAVPNQPIWGAIRRRQPDLMVHLGDLVYADTEDDELLGEALRRLGRRPRFRKLLRHTTFLSVWDDHDFGPNDSDGRHGNKEGVRDTTLDFWMAPADDPRRSQEGGLYGSWSFGPEGRRVQVVLLDTRWSLSPRAARTDGGVGRYAPGAGQVLGEAQWAWLEAPLAQPADLRIVGSSIPYATEHTGWETWANFPREQARLSRLLQQAGPLLVVSGDVHYGELSLHEGVYDLTSSGLSGTPYPLLPNAHRVDELAHVGEHAAEIAIDWEGQAVQLRFFDPSGREHAGTTLPFAQLDPAP